MALGRPHRVDRRSTLTNPAPWPAAAGRPRVAATDLDWGSTSPTSPQTEVDSGAQLRVDPGALFLKSRLTGDSACRVLFGAASDEASTERPFSTTSLWQVPPDWNVGHHHNARGHKHLAARVAHSLLVADKAAAGGVATAAEGCGGGKHRRRALLAARARGGISAMLRNLSNMVSVEAAELRHSDARRDELQVYLCTDEISAEMRKLPQANIAGMAALDTLQLHSMMLSASALAPARTVLLLQTSIPLTLLLSRLRPCSPFRRVPHLGLGAITNGALCRHLHVTPSVSHPSRPPLAALR